MGNFIGRKSELRALEDLYQRAGFQMCVVYGRRRIGKSTLLKQFIEGKTSVYYTAVKTTANRNLELLTNRVMETFSPDLKSFVSQSYEELFSYLTEKCKKDRIIVVIDEFPYLAEADAGMTSILQKVIDHEWQYGNMFLILSGSSLSFMEEKVLSEKSPLFGRRTAQIRLKPFDYKESAEFVKKYTYEEKAICYGVTGGVAKYLSLFDDNKSFDENMIELFFSKSGYMFEETSNLLTQEFRNISLYSAVIESIASGENKANEIAAKAHIDNTSVAHALKNLMLTGIVKKEFAITDENNKKKVQYVLEDHMFRFWYRYVPNGIDVIEMDKGEVYYRNVVRPHLAEYMGAIFEEMCRWYTLKIGIEEKLQCLITNIGRWWGNNPEKKEQTDIDVVGLSPIEKKAVIGECKFWNKSVDKQIFDELFERRNLLSKNYQVVQYLLFTKGNFSDWLIKRAEEEDLVLVTLEEMYDEKQE